MIFKRNTCLTKINPVFYLKGTTGWLLLQGYFKRKGKPKQSGRQADNFDYNGGSGRQNFLKRATPPIYRRKFMTKKEWAAQ